MAKEKWEAIIDFVKKNNYKKILELGVGGAFTSEQILKSCELERYYLVDPYYGRSDVPPTLKNIIDSFNNIVFFKLFSKEAVKEIADDNLDLIYIDADHAYEHVKEDIKIWYPKVRKGGIVCGHDYDVPEWEGVKRAVDEIFKNVNIIIDADKGCSNKIWWHKK